MRVPTRLLALLITCGAASGTLAREAPPREWKQVHPFYKDAYVLSFRSPDLLSNDPDERWGSKDARLVSGGILTDFPIWLREHEAAIETARAQGRPILLSLHTHSGYGAGLVTYEVNLRSAEAATYPWLIRTLNKHGLNTPDVTVAIDTCNAQATAAYQLRPDLYKNGVLQWANFARWRRAHPARVKLPVTEAFRIFTQDHVRQHLVGAARRSRENVRTDTYALLTPEERKAFKGRVYGPKGVIFGTPALFNLLRLGPNPQGTMTANLFTAKLDGRVVDGYLGRNKVEFRRFREFAFLSAAGSRDGVVPPPHAAPAVATKPTADPRVRTVDDGGQ